MATDTQEDAKAPEPEPKKESATEPKGEQDAAHEAEPPKAKEAPKGAAAAKVKTPRKPFVLPQPLLLAGVAVVALAAGVAIGGLLIAPRVIAARAAHPAAPEANEKPGKGGERSRPIVYRIDNLVVNPAGSAGARFLMTAVAFELPDEKSAAALREREAQVRDMVIATLASQTMDQLTAPGARDSLKLRLTATVAPLCSRPQDLHVYLPQFVIQ